METAMHAARLVAVQSALLALFTEQQGQQDQLDGMTVVFSHFPDSNSLDVTYTRNGTPVAGEGM